MNNFCGECGSKLQDGVKFCSECGHQIIIETTRTDDAMTNTNVTPHNLRDELKSELNEGYQYNNIEEKSKKLINDKTKKRSKKAKKSKTRADYVQEDKKKKRVGKTFRNIAIVLVIVMIFSTFLGSDIHYDFVSSKDEAPLDLMQAMLSSPFYYYDNGIPGDKADRIKSYINERANDSLDVAKLLYEEHENICMEMDVMYDVITQIRLNQDMDEYLYKMLIAYESLYTLSETHKLNYESSKVFGYDNSYVNADSLSQKLYEMIISTGYLYESFEILSIVAASMVAGQGISDPSLSQNEIDMILVSFENTEILSKLDTMAIYTSVIEENINLVNTAKLEVSMENIEYALSLSQELENNMDSLDQVNHELLTSEMKKDIRDAADIAAYDLLVAKDYVDELLSNTSHNNQIELAYIEENSIIPVAYADSNVALDKKVDLEKTVKKVKVEKKGWFASMVDTVVKVGGEIAVDIASDVNTAITPFKKIIGSGVEVINGAAGAVITYGVYKYEGLSASDTKDAIDEVVQTSVDKLKSGTAGSTVFKKSLEYINDTSEAAKRGMSLIGTVMGGASIHAYEKLTGDKVSEENKNWIQDMGEKAGSFIGGVASGAFTGIATGSSKILDNEASDVEVASGIFDIATSLYGSSSNIGSVSGAGSSAKNIYKNISTNTSKIAKNSASASLKEGVKEGIEESSKSWFKSFKTSASNFKSDFIKSAKKNYTDALKNSITTGSITPKEIIDTLSGSYFDGLISNGYNDMINSVNKVDVDTSVLSNEGNISSLIVSSDLGDSTSNDNEQVNDTENTNDTESTNDTSDNSLIKDTGDEEDTDISTDTPIDTNITEDDKFDYEDNNTDNDLTSDIENNNDTSNSDAEIEIEDNQSIEDNQIIDEEINDSDNNVIDSASIFTRSTNGNYDDFLMSFMKQGAVIQNISMQEVFSDYTFEEYKILLESDFKYRVSEFPAIARFGNSVKDNEVYFFLLAENLGHDNLIKFRNLFENRFGKFPDEAYEEGVSYFEGLLENN